MFWWHESINPITKCSVLFRRLSYWYGKHTRFNMVNFCRYRKYAQSVINALAWTIQFSSEPERTSVQHRTVFKIGDGIFCVFIYAVTSVLKVIKESKFKLNKMAFGAPIRTFLWLWKTWAKLYPLTTISYVVWRVQRPSHFRNCYLWFKFIWRKIKIKREKQVFLKGYSK